MVIGKPKREIDLSAFPPASVTEYSTLVCLACTFDIFTTQLGLASRTAYSEIKKYCPTVAELTAPKALPPFFDSEEKHPHCPYCQAAKRWHARFDTTRIEGEKATDVARRKLIKTLPQKDGQFQVIDARSDKRTSLFDWLETLGQNLDMEDGAWLNETTRAFLGRSHPKTDWVEVFAGVRTVRRSQRLTDGWEREGTRLFLAPILYSEVLLVQYLVSRSHVNGGQTLAGRLTLPELIRRLRYGGYLDAKEISGGDQFEILDQLIDKLSGGSGKTRLYYIVDRRNFLEKVKSVYARYAS
jgi:ribosomal protein L33